MLECNNKLQWEARVFKHYGCQMGGLEQSESRKLMKQQDNMQERRYEAQIGSLRLQLQHGHWSVCISFILLKS